MKKPMLILLILLLAGALVCGLLAREEKLAPAGAGVTEATAAPTTEPTEAPTAAPTAEPTEAPTATPTAEPAEAPAAEPAPGTTPTDLDAVGKAALTTNV